MTAKIEKTPDGPRITLTSGLKFAPASQPNKTLFDGRTIPSLEEPQSTNNSNIPTVRGNSLPGQPPILADIPQFGFELSTIFNPNKFHTREEIERALSDIKNKIKKYSTQVNTLENDIRNNNKAIGEEELKRTTNKNNLEEVDRNFQLAQKNQQALKENENVTHEDTKQDLDLAQALRLKINKLKKLIESSKNHISTLKHLNEQKKANQAQLQSRSKQALHLLNILENKLKNVIADNTSKEPLQLGYTKPQNPAEKHLTKGNFKALTTKPQPPNEDQPLRLTYDPQGEEAPPAEWKDRESATTNPTNKNTMGYEQYSNKTVSDKFKPLNAVDAKFAPQSAVDDVTKDQNVSEQPKESTDQTKEASAEKTPEQKKLDETYPTNKNTMGYEQYSNKTVSDKFKPLNAVDAKFAPQSAVDDVTKDQNVSEQPKESTDQTKEASAEKTPEQKKLDETYPTNKNTMGYEQYSNKTVSDKFKPLNAVDAKFAPQSAVDDVTKDQNVSEQPKESTDQTKEASAEKTPEQKKLDETYPTNKNTMGYEQYSNKTVSDKFKPLNAVDAKFAPQSAVDDVTKDQNVSEQPKESTDQTKEASAEKTPEQKKLDETYQNAREEYKNKREEYEKAAQEYYKNQGIVGAVGSGLRYLFGGDKIPNEIAEKKRAFEEAAENRRVAFAYKLQPKATEFTRATELTQELQPNAAERTTKKLIKVEKAPAERILKYFQKISELHEKRAQQVKEDGTSENTRLDTRFMGFLGKMPRPIKIGIGVGVMSGIGMATGAHLVGATVAALGRVGGGVVGGLLGSYMGKKWNTTLRKKLESKLDNEQISATRLMQGDNVTENKSIQYLNNLVKKQNEQLRNGDRNALRRQIFCAMVGGTLAGGYMGTNPENAASGFENAFSDSPIDSKPIPDHILRAETNEELLAKKFLNDEDLLMSQEVVFEPKFSSYAVQSGDNMWDIIKKQVVMDLAGKEASFDANLQSSADINNVVGNILERVKEDPSAYGLAEGQDINKLEIGQSLDLQAIYENAYKPDITINGTTYGDLGERAANLNAAEIENIENYKAETPQVVSATLPDLGINETVVASDTFEALPNNPVEQVAIDDPNVPTKVTKYASALSDHLHQFNPNAEFSNQLTVSNGQFVYTPPSGIPITVSEYGYSAPSLTGDGAGEITIEPKKLFGINIDNTGSMVERLLNKIGYYEYLDNGTGPSLKNEILGWDSDSTTSSDSGPSGASGTPDSEARGRSARGA